MTYSINMDNHLTPYTHKEIVLDTLYNDLVTFSHNCTFYHVNGGDILTELSETEIRDIPNDEIIKWIENNQSEWIEEKE